MQVSKIDGITKATTLDLDFHGIMELIATHGYSGSTFRDGHRSLQNFEQTNLVILDIDEELTLVKAEKRLNGYKYILALTRNHQKIKTTKTGKKKPACDRFRIILFLDGIITKKEDYKNTCHQLLTMFPELDTQCSEASRFFYASTEIYSYSDEGRLVTIAEYNAPKQSHTEQNSTGLLGNLSRNTKDFLANGAEEGTWNGRLFSASLDLNEQNYPMDIARTLLEAVDQPFDESDTATFESAYDREPKYAPRSNVLTIGGFDNTTGTGGTTPPPPATYEGLVIPFFESNLRVWLDTLFDMNNVAVDEKDNIVCNGKKMAFDFFRNTIYIATGESKKHKYDSKGEKVLDKFKNPVVISTSIANRGLVDSYINKWMDEEKFRIIQRVRDKIAYVADNGEVEKFVSFITTSNVKLTECVIKQFIYNVKIKLNRNHPKFILMPVFVGKQGVGKSLAVQKLLEPIKHMSAPVNFEIFKDSREFKGTFGEKLVLEFDEMSSAKKTDIEAVKNKITAERINYRVLGTTQNSTLFNMSSMIGSSNSTLIDLLYDDTGKRRFYEVICKIDAFWQDIEGIDSLALWQSVDINQPPPILDHLDELTEVQQGYKNLNSIEEFLIDEGLIPEGDDKTFNINRNELYKQYAEAMALQRRQPFSRNKFYDKCRMFLKEEESHSRIKNFIVREGK
jgi:hypothetical protein